MYRIYMMFRQTYKKTDGSKGLVTYEHTEIKTKELLIKQWEHIFIDQYTEYIDGPVLIPQVYLQNSGHLSKYNTDREQIYLINPYLALRPETCSTIFAYYKAKYGNRFVNTNIAQLGKSFRNEKSTRNLDYRLNEFYQLQIQCMEAINVSQTELVIENNTYYVTPKFKQLYLKSIIYFKNIDCPVVYRVIHDTPFYCRFSIDIFLSCRGTEIQVGCLNDRGEHDIGSARVTELSIGLHRLIIYKTREKK